MVVKSIFALTLTFCIALILVSSLSLAIQYGNLRVKVVDCSCNNPVSDARVCVQSIETDPCEYTDSNGEILFENLVVGTYSIQVSKDGYNPNSTVENVECSRTVDVTICLSKVKVCNPGEIVNRRCACPTQVVYERCKTDGSGWETVIENCQSGYVCSNGYCVKSKDGWYDTWETRCDLEGRSCGYGIKEIKQEYRDYTCFGATCTYVVTQTRWVAVDECYVPCPTTTTTTIPVQEKDGWYDTGYEKCEVNNVECGIGVKMKEQEYRDYTCFGTTCVYNVLSKRWIEDGICYKTCPSGYLCKDGYCNPIFDCNSLDGWYSTMEERCITNFECGAGEKQVKEEYRDYYPTIPSPISSSDCSFNIKEIRWRSVGECYVSCPIGYYCDSGFCRPIKITTTLPKECEVKIWVKEKETKQPIESARVCFNNNCYLTDSFGLVTFYVKIGTYNIQISKEGYSWETIKITCQECGNSIQQTVYLSRIKSCFDCNTLDGWYYTTESYCEIGDFRCGNGIRLRKEEFRDYPNICVKSSTECKNYSIIGYRWVDEGYCYKGCDFGTCEEGLCKQRLSYQDVQLSFNEKRYEHPKAKIIEINVIVIFLAVLIGTIIAILMLLKNRKRRREEIF